jgi:hypothetical protein
MKSKMCLAVLALIVSFATAGLAQTKGNGLPKNQKLLYNLEVIAYDGNNCPAGDQIGSSGHRIAVKADVSDNPSGANPNTLVRQNDIMLGPGPFAVLDGNACNDGVAVFQLPLNPCADTLDQACSLDDPTFQEYEVYERLVGKPGTGIDVTTCATNDGGTPNDPTDDIVVCSAENLVDMRQKGTAPKFVNHSKELLTICVDTTGDGVCDTRLALFAPQFKDYFWNWNTDGKAHAQLFFVAVPDSN